LNLGQMQAIVSQRLNEAAAPVFYPATEINAAINEAQRFFALVTLCIERSANWTVTKTFTHMTTPFPGWIAPLRITSAAGAKIRPGRFSDLWALDSQWPMAQGTPRRYVHAGSDLVAVYPTPYPSAVVVAQYAGIPAALVNAADVPEIPVQFHELLPKYAIYRCRQSEGAGEFEKAAGYFDEFMTAATDYANYIRSRNIGAGYDTLPPEIEGLDRSHAARRRTKSA